MGLGNHAEERAGLKYAERGDFGISVAIIQCGAGQENDNG